MKTRLYSYDNGMWMGMHWDIRKSPWDEDPRGEWRLSFLKDADGKTTCWTRRAHAEALRRYADVVEIDERSDGGPLPPDIYDEKQIARLETEGDVITGELAAYGEGSAYAIQAADVEIDQSGAILKFTPFARATSAVLAMETLERVLPQWRELERIVEALEAEGGEHAFDSARAIP